MSEDVKTSEDIQFGFSFDNKIDEFHVEGKKERRNEQGGLEAGMQYRWVLSSDRRNVENKIRSFGYAPCTDEGITVPGAQEGGKGAVPKIKINNEEFILMERPVAVAKAEAARYRERFETGFEETSSYSGGGGVTSKFKAQFSKTGRFDEGSPKGKYIRKGR